MDPCTVTPESFYLEMDPWTVTPESFYLEMDPWTVTPESFYLEMDPWTVTRESFYLEMDPWTVTPESFYLEMDPWTVTPESFYLEMDPCTVTPESSDSHEWKQQIPEPSVCLVCKSHCVFGILPFFFYNFCISYLEMDSYTWVICSCNTVWRLYQFATWWMCNAWTWCISDNLPIFMEES